MFISTCVMAKDMQDKQLTKYKEDIIGTWIVGESMYIVTPKYVLYIPGKKMSYDTYMNGKISSYKIEPSKYFYAISKGGDYIFRALRWYRIEGKKDNMVLDNRKFFIRVGPIKLFSYDGGGVLRKISDSETIKRLKDYDLDYNIIRNLPINTHQDVPTRAKAVYDSGANMKDVKMPIEENSLLDVIEKFLEQNKK